MKLTWYEIGVAVRMRDRGASVRGLAKHLGVTEGALRYRLKRAGEDVRSDGRARQATALDGYEEAVAAVQERLGDGRLDGSGRPCQVRLIYCQATSGTGPLATDKTGPPGRVEGVHEVASSELGCWLPAGDGRRLVKPRKSPLRRFSRSR